MWMYIYDIRGIQEYIFRTNKIKEIIGASKLVENILLDLFSESCTQEKVKCFKDYSDSGLVIDKKGSEYDAEIVYYGGGNLLVIFKDNDIAQKVNKRMRIEVVKRTYSLNLAIAGIEVGSDFSKRNYVADKDKLYQELDRVKLSQPMLSPAISFPFTLNDPDSDFPFSKKDSSGQRVTYEQKLKMDSYNSIKDINLKANINEFVEKGDSMIAIVHIDGNNMGQFFQNVTDKADSYDSAVQRIRIASKTVNKVFTESALRFVEDEIEKMNLDHPIFRTIINAGDDITFICNAHVALKCVTIFFQKIKEDNHHFTASSGIFIQHSHFPFSVGYDLAEQLCANAKSKGRDNFYIDFQIHRGAILNDLEEIRKNEYKKVERPYLWNPDEASSTTVKTLLELVCDIKRKTGEDEGIARNKLKGLREKYYYRDDLYVKMEIKRINSRLQNGINEMINLGLLFDAIDILDLDWEK